MNKFDQKEYELMAGITEYLIKKNMAFCFTEDGRLVDLDTAKNYIIKYHANFCNMGV
jgi:hypothetical protein